MPLISNMIRQLGPWGLYALARFLTRRQPKLLMYHHFAKKLDSVNTGIESFEKQLIYIKRHFRPVTATQLAAEYYSDKGIEANTICITVDDGYLDFYEHAFPLLKKYEIPATLYVASSFVDKQKWLWTDYLHWLFELSGSQRPAVELEEFTIPAAITDEQSWMQRSYQLNGYLLTLPDEKKWAILRQLTDDWGLEVPDQAQCVYRACNISQLREMQMAGIEIGGHTVNHPSLGRVSLGVAKQEITDCFQWLQDNLGKQPRSFCYPNGQPEDYSSDIKKLVADSGFTCAVTAFSDSLGMSDRWAVRRNCGGGNLFHVKKVLNGTEWLGDVFRSEIIKRENFK